MRSFFSDLLKKKEKEKKGTKTKQNDDKEQRHIYSKNWDDL